MAEARTVSTAFPEQPSQQEVAGQHQPQPEPHAAIFVQETPDFTPPLVHRDAPVRQEQSLSSLVVVVVVGIVGKTAEVEIDDDNDELEPGRNQTDDNDDRSCLTPSCLTPTPWSRLPTI